MVVVDLDRTIEVPVGRKTLGRVFNVLGDTIDGLEDLEEPVQRQSIYRAAPTYEDLTNDYQILETGIKVIDLLAPYLKGVKLASLVEPVSVKLY